MMKFNVKPFFKILLVIGIVFPLVGWSPFSLVSLNNSESIGSTLWVEQETKALNRQVDNLDPAILKLSLKAYSKIRQEGYDNKQLLTIIDYSKPSTERRLWVIDLKKQKVLFNTWVSHGKNSGAIKSNSFSNNPGSLKSSLGVFVTDHTPYEGGNGYSLRLIGLERGINNNAYNREIVIHGAWYVGAEVVKKYGQLGRSWGCPAVNKTIAKPLIDTIKDKTLVFAYYPDYKWLWTSHFLA